MSGRRRWPWVVGGLALLIVALAIAGALLLRPGRIVETALAEARRATGYAVTTGRVSVRLTPSGPGLRVNDLHMVAPDSSEIVDAVRADASAEFVPLLRGKLALKRVVLDRLRVERREAAPSAGRRVSSPLPGLLVAPSWAVREARFTQHARDGEIALTGIEAEGGLAWTPGKDGAGTVRARIGEGRWRSGKLEGKVPGADLTAEFTVTAAVDSIAITSGKGHVGGIEFRSQGGFRATAGVWSGIYWIRARPFTWAEARELLPESIAARLAGFEIETRYLDGYAHWRIDATGRSSIDGGADFRDVSIRAVGATVGLSRGEGVVRFRPDGFSVELQQSRLGQGAAGFMLDSRRISAGVVRRTGKLAVRNLDGATLAGLFPPKVGLTLSGGMLDLMVERGPETASWLAAQPPLELHGTATLDRLEGTWKGKPLLVDGTLSFEGDHAALRAKTLRALGHALTDVTARCRLDDGALRVDDLSAAAYGGRARGRFSVTRGDAGAGTAHEGALSLSGIDLGAALAEWLPIGRRVEGAAAAEILWAGRSARGLDPLASLDVEAAVALEKGALLDVGSLAELAQSLNVSGATAERWPFDRLVAALALYQGHVIVDTLHAAQPGMGWQLFGAVGLDGSLDLDGLVRADPARVSLPPELKPFAPYLAEADGRIPIDFKLSGSFAEPSVSLDWGALGKRAAARARGEGVQSLQRRIESALKNPAALEKLKKMFGKKPGG